jgi:hypothetical protein
LDRLYRDHRAKHGLPSLWRLVVCQYAENRIGQPALGVNEASGRVLPACLPVEAVQPRGDVVDQPCVWTRLDDDAAKRHGEVRLAITFQVCVPCEGVNAPSHAQSGYGTGCIQRPVGDTSSHIQTTFTEHC